MSDSFFFVKWEELLEGDAQLRWYFKPPPPERPDFSGMDAKSRQKSAAAYAKEKRKWEEKNKAMYDTFKHRAIYRRLMENDPNIERILRRPYTETLMLISIQNALL